MPSLIKLNFNVMKKQALLPALFLLFLFILTFNKVKAAPGDSCTSAISLTPSNSFSDYAFHSPDTAVWFSFIADSANMVVSLSTPVLPADTPTEYLHTLKLYSGNCSGLTLLASNSIHFGSDSLPTVYYAGLTHGTRYYISISKYNTMGCRICNKYPSYFSINVYGIFSTVMSLPPCATACGPNLVCNWNFMGAPSPPACYDMPSASPSCGATSDMSYTNYGAPNCFFGSNLPDYLIQSTTDWYFRTAYMSPAGPGTETYSFWGDSPPNFSGSCPIAAWQQTISGLIVGANYQFKMYYMDLDNITNYPNMPPATLSMKINAGSPLWTGNAATNSWTPTCVIWTANSTVANLQILDACEPNGIGYDFQLNEISFEMTQLPTFTITASPSSICLGQSTILTVAPSIPGYTYTWSGGTSPGTGTSVSASPTITTTYVLTVTGPTPCSSIAMITVTVNPLPPAPIVSVPAMACGPTTVTVTNPAVGASYTWSVNGGTNNSITSPGTSVTANIGIAATLTCVATYTATGCTSSTTFTMAPCCTSTVTSVGGPKYNQIINGNQLASVAGHSFLNQTILINGTFTIDMNTIFTACDVQFTSGSSIIVNSGKTLDIYSTSSTCSHFHAAAGCCMWQGIIINPGGNLVSTPLSGTLMPLMIEDAIAAIGVTTTANVTPGSYQLNQVIFNKNWQDIVVNLYTPIVYDPYGSAVNCMFTCRDLSSHPPCYWYQYVWSSSATNTTLICPHTNQQSHIGISLTNVGGYTNFFKCFFDYHDYGVYASSSNVGVYGNFFQNLMANAGTGVYATSVNGNTLTVGNPLNTERNEFHNCKCGVEAFNNMNNVSVLDNEFINTTEGNAAVVCEFNTKKGRIILSYDTITNFQVGIWASNNSPATVTINNNTINNTFCISKTPYYYGIYDAEFSSTAQHIIQKNGITSLNFGIECTGLYNATLFNNVITLGPPGGGCNPNYCLGDGIEFLNGNTSRIDANYITAPYQEFYASHTVALPKYVGIYESMSPALSMRCNNITNAPTQIWNFLPSTLLSKIVSNTLNAGGTNDIGIEYSSSTFSKYQVGGSGPAGNWWSTTTAFACRNDVTYSGPVPWYNYQGSVGNCSSNYYPNCGCIALTRFGGFPAINDSSCPGPAIIYHSGPVVLVDSLGIDSTISDSIPSAFTMLPDSFSIAYMGRVGQGHDSAGMLDDTTRIFNVEGLLEVLWRNKSLLTSYTILNHFNDSMKATTLGRIWRVDSSINYINGGGSVSGGYTAILDTLNLITPAGNIETNLKTVLTDYLNLMINDSLTSTQISGLWTLSDLCPKNDGQGVYMARALVSPYDTVQVTWQDSLCGSGNTPHRADRREATPKVTDNVQFNLYPNPNNGNFTLEYDLGKGVSGYVKLYNTMGQLVGEYNLANSQGMMSISNPQLSNGVYIWKLYTNTDTMKYGRVIIMK